MNQKNMAKHARKRTVTALRMLLTAAVLLGSRSMVMTVRAENEMAMPSEDMVSEAWEQPESESEEMTPAQAENVEETAMVQEESGENVPAPENAEQAALPEAGNTEAAVQEQAGNPLEGKLVTMIGDSVMLGAAPSLQELLPGCVIDAKVSRQMIQADDVLASLESQNAVGQIVVIALGTNGPFGVEKGQALIDRLGSDRTIYWVTVYGRELAWQEASNTTIRTLAENNENVRLIDWTQAASGHAEWICSDGIHLSAAGRAGYAGVVAGELMK